MASIVFIVRKTLAIVLGNLTQMASIELVFRASEDLSVFGKLSYKTLQLFEQSQSLDGNPIFAILHEAIYCQGYVGPPL